MSTISIDKTNAVTPVAGIVRIGIGLALGALSAVLLILAFQPYSIWPLAFVAYVPMGLAAQRVLPRKWSGLAPAVGIGGFLAVFLTSLFGFGEFAWLFLGIAMLVAAIGILSTPTIRKFHERTGYRWYVLQGAVDTAAIEMIRSFIPPINTHAFMAQTMYTQPWMLQAISIFNVYGLTLVIMLINYALALGVILLFDRKWQWDERPAMDLPAAWRWWAITGITFVVWAGIGVVILATSPKDAPIVRVAAIQHGFIPPGHMDPGTQEARLAELSTQTRSAASQGAVLMVWPELGLGFDPQVEHTAELQSLAAETNAYILIGYGVTDDPRGWRNEAVMLAPSGEFLPVYGKNHPSSPGEPPIVTSGVYPVYDTPFGRFGTVICNDVSFTDSSRILARDGAQLISVPTYETSVPGFHWEVPIQGVLRAVENHVATVKADTAYSAMIVDPYGRILAHRDAAPEGEAFALIADVPLGAGTTITTRLGDWVGWLALAGFIVLTVIMNLKPRKKEESDKPLATDADHVQS
jgi:apolipoprotein N-acyltransferase